MTVTAPGTIDEVGGIDAARFCAEIAAAGRPVVMRGLVADWPAAAAARQGTGAAVDYLRRFDTGAGAVAFVAPPETGGRFFYSEDLAGFNFERRPGAFASIVAAVAGLGERAQAPSVYVGSTPVTDVLPGFERENRLDLPPPGSAVPRIWIGNRSIVSTHFDESDNIACAVAGRRRFTLFPPDQVANLYVGPLDFTMAGQPTSLVDTRAPDFERYPRYRDALTAALRAELDPGDAIYIPALWWHSVEAEGAFNILVNYWWRALPEDAGAGMEAMAHAILGIAALPAPQRAAWRAMFDHYVFRPSGDDPAEHLPEARRGILGNPTAEIRGRIRMFLQKMLAALS